jgi:hypothetical protein
MIVMARKIEKFLRRRSLVYMAERAVVSKMWASNFVLMDDGRVHDLYEDGQLGCAYFVLTLLKVNELWNLPITGFAKKARDGLESQGWYQINEIKPGAVIVYQPEDFGREWSSMHIGIAVSDTESVSNDSNEEGIIYRHPHQVMGIKNRTNREIESIWWHKDFEDDDLFYADEDGERLTAARSVLESE